jgi:RimJ/RimL family protein N-acetyltransferase
MRLTPGIMINSIGESECGEFFQYLNDHRSDNGRGENGFFIPISQTKSCLPYDKEEAFRDGLNVPVGSPGWRRAWVARASDGQIVGHIDLWSHPVSFAEHRCLLGMGVHRNHRRLGLGASLLSHATEWALANTALEWFDLHVLSANEPAIRLYLRSGFTQVGEVAEMFKLDGRLFSDTTMAKRIREDQL